MRIAFIVDAFPVVSETFILNQITGLIDAGHQVEIFAGMISNTQIEHPEVDKYGLSKKVHLLNQRPQKWGIRLVEGFIKVWKYGHRNPRLILNSLNFFKYGKEAISLNYFYKVAAFEKMGRFDILFCHFGPNGKIGVLLKEIGVKGKVITAFHGYDILKYYNKNDSQVYKQLFLKGDLFLPVSNYWKKKLIEMGCPRNKIIVHHMGVDLQKYKYIQHNADSDEKITILTVARLIPKKGLENSIRAVLKLIRENSKIRYNIVGDGILRDKLASLINKYGANDNIILHGWVIGDELMRLFQEANIFLLNSVTTPEGDMEGIPVSIMEAQAVGLPVISTWHSGIPEIVKDGKSGYLVHEDDIEKMIKSIKLLINDHIKRENMGLEGRKIIENYFNINNLNTTLITIFMNYSSC